MNKYNYEIFLASKPNFGLDSEHEIHSIIYFACSIY